jgi:hypothetical protein
MKTLSPGSPSAFPAGVRAPRRGRARLARWGLCGLLAVAPLFAAKRVVEIDLPGRVSSGAAVLVAVRASTDAAAGEQVGFLHAEYSLDAGKTWTAFCYEKDVGPSVVRQTTLKAGASGSEIRVRARVAFRGGADGDVDFKGAPINWEADWHDWSEPPARSAVAKVTGR